MNEVLSAAMEENLQQSELLSKYNLWTTLRIKSWIYRFISNCKKSLKERTTGPIITIDIREQRIIDYQTYPFSTRTS